MTLRLAFVSPRWAPEAAGGAEVLSRLLAEHLAARGHRVEALATCADDPHTWRNTRRPGTEEVNGVTVRRFPADEGRVSGDFLALQDRISRGHRVTRREEERWIAGSVVSTELNRCLSGKRDDFDAFIFVPYLFGVTWFGSAICPRKSLLIPCLHDEPFAALSIYADMFRRFRGFLFNSLPEMDLARRLYGVPREKSFLVSMGFDEPPPCDPGRFLRERGIRTPFLLYAGRREEGKNTHLLVEYFRLYRSRRGGRAALVLIGTGGVRLERQDRDGIYDFGYVSSRDKLDAMAACLAFCQPSTNESFSIVLMETWLAGRPVLVHDRCAVTRDHASRSGGGLWFEDYLTFEACLDWFIDHPGEARAMADRGGAYVRENYSWDTVLDRCEEALRKSLARPDP